MTRLTVDQAIVYFGRFSRQWHRGQITLRQWAERVSDVIDAIDSTPQP